MPTSIRRRVFGCMWVDGNFGKELIVEESIVGLGLLFHVHLVFFLFLILLLCVLNSDCIMDFALKSVLSSFLLLLLLLILFLFCC